MEVFAKTGVDIFTFEPFRITRIDWNERVVYARFDTFFEEIALPLLLSGFGLKDHTKFPKSRIFPNSQEGLDRYGLRRIDDTTVVAVGRQVATEKDNYYTIYYYEDCFAIVNQDEEAKESEGGPIIYPYITVDERPILEAMVKEIAQNPQSLEFTVECFSVNTDTTGHKFMLWATIRDNVTKRLSFKTTVAGEKEPRGFRKCVNYYLKDRNNGLVFFIPATDPPLIKRVNNNNEK